MKISKFADKFNVGNDTIRYYMQLNLLIPEKRGGHYHFNQDCQSDMEEILKLKEMDFSLQEIKEIFHFKRIGKLSAYQRDNYYQSIYKEKVQEINTKLANLKRAREELEGEITKLEARNKESLVTFGIDLAALPLFACPICKSGGLLLEAARVEANQIIEGSLNCKCGESLQIKGGILYASNLESGEKDVEVDHIENYIKVTNPDYIDELYQGIEWLQRQIEFPELAGKVILEPGSGYGHFLRQIYEKLPEDVIYVCIDHNPHINQYLKGLLEMAGKRARTIFITAQLPELPLKEDVADVMIDFTGTSDYSFQNEGFLPESLDHYVKERATIYATFIIYDHFGPNTIVAEPFRDNFRYKNIREGLLRLGYQLNEEYASDVVKVEESMGKYESFAQIGDRLQSYQVKGKRWS